MSSTTIVGPRSVVDLIGSLHAVVTGLVEAEWSLPVVASSMSFFVGGVIVRGDLVWSIVRRPGLRCWLLCGSSCTRESTQ